MGKTDKIIEQLSRQGIMPLFYHDDVDVCYEVVNALYEGGVRIIEFTNRGKNAPENFKKLVKRRDEKWQDLLLPVGTVKNLKDAKVYMKAGADFIVSPGVSTEVGKKVQDAGLLWVPGCMTPTEIMVAEECGAELVKLFPGNMLGPGFMGAIRELFPAVKFMPTGGVELEKENLKAWFDSGVCAVGMGSKLLSKQILVNRDYEKITQLTKEAMLIIRELKAGS